MITGMLNLLLAGCQRPETFNATTNLLYHMLLFAYLYSHLPMLQFYYDWFKEPHV
jgi:hypothetical protein